MDLKELEKIYLPKKYVKSHNYSENLNISVKDASSFAYYLE